VLTFHSQAYVNFTVRNNGPINANVTAELYIDGSPYYYAGSIVSALLFPAPEGGTVSGSFQWIPSFLGFLTISVELIVPSTDTYAPNNVLGNSLFAQQLYVNYNVLLVDDTLCNPNMACLANHHETTPYVYSSLIAAGFPSTTMYQANITKGCGSLPANVLSRLTSSPPGYNLVVWNLGDTVNASGQCTLSLINMNALVSFLSFGGLSSSLLVIGNGILTEKADPQMVNLAGTYLGFKLSSELALPSAPSSTIFGSNNSLTDAVGDGVAIPYSTTGGASVAGNNTFQALNTTAPNLIESFSFFYNVPDFWTVPASPYAAGVSAYALAGWNSEYWAFNLATVQGNSGGMNMFKLALLRFATASGRLLPAPDAIVDAPDITFATSTSAWTNFDHMHPQLEQQYLLEANITNLGGVTVNNVAVSVLDGSHILAQETVTAGPTSYAAFGKPILGIAQISVSWTPLYGSTNPIIVKITSSIGTPILPGIAQTAQWNVTVYFFYDTTQTNANQWSHNNMIFWQDAENPNCGSPPVGTQIYFSDDINVPVAWPLTDQSQNDCPPTSYTAAAAHKWGMDFTTCYLQIWICGSEAVYDDEAHTNSVVWGYTADITVPAGVTNAFATWEQSYNLAPYESGGVVCVEIAPTNCPTAPIGAGMASPSPGYTGTIIYSSGGCDVVSSFTGSNSGSANGWTLEQLNLSAYKGDTIRVGFGFIEGTTGTCGGTSVATADGWWIDQFSVFVTGGSLTPLTYAYGNCPTFGSATTPATGIPGDIWHLTSTLPSSFTTTPTAIPTGGAWEAAASYTTGNSLTLDPNMWDLLESRPIDLSNAANATMSFNYLWSRVTPNMDPPQGLVMEVTPVLANGVTNWVQVWSANMPQGTPVRAMFNTHWQTANVSLQGYLGEVIRVGFLVGSNCGGDGDDDAMFDYPTQTTPTTGVIDCANTSGGTETGTNAQCNPGDGPTAALISGIYVSGATTITPTNVPSPPAARATPTDHDRGGNPYAPTPGHLGSQATGSVITASAGSSESRYVSLQQQFVARWMEG
jgi:hypothetical protein